MQAPIVPNVASITSSPTPAAKQQSAPNGGFNQMLNQQIADRGSANKASKPVESTSANKANKVNAPTKPTEANKANNASNAGPDPVTKQTPANATEATDAKLAGKEDTAVVDGLQLADNSAAVPVSAELMALMANQFNKESPAGTALDEATAAAAGVTAPALTTTTAALPLAASTSKDARTVPLTDQTNALSIDRAATKTEVTAEVDKTNVALADNESSLKPTGAFATTMAAIQPSAESKQSPQLVSAKIQESALATATSTTPQLQQIAQNVAQTVSAPPTDKLSPPVGSPAWDQAVGQKVVWMVAGAQQSASLTLNPPDLGPLQVVLNVSNGHADATFTANQPEVRQALEAAMPKLREMMSDAGIQLGQTTISAGTPNQQNQSGEQAKQNSRGINQTGDAQETTVRPSGTTRTIGGQGLVDTFA